MKAPIICPIPVRIIWRSLSALFCSLASSISLNCFSQAILSFLASSFAAISSSTIAFPAFLPPAICCSLPLLLWWLFIVWVTLGRRTRGLLPRRTRGCMLPRRTRGCLLYRRIKGFLLSTGTRGFLLSR